MPTILRQYRRHAAPPGPRTLVPVPGPDPQWTLMGYYALDGAIREALQTQGSRRSPRPVPVPAGHSEEPVTLMGYYALNRSIRRALEDLASR
jgi:hypothetical protein